MIELFAGSATLCSIAKQWGLRESLAVAKSRKKSARCSIHTLDLLQPSDRALLEEWMRSDLLAWIHLAPACSTATRPRAAWRGSNEPRPLRNDDYPLGLPTLSGSEATRVALANELFQYSCEVFRSAAARGILVTLENPRNSYFWQTPYFLGVQQHVCTARADFQLCMYGGSRDRWTSILANYPHVSQMSVRCDGKHLHAAWGKAFDLDGREVWATSLESQYPRKMCISLVHTVLNTLRQQGVRLLPESIQELDAHPLLIAQRDQISAGQQPRRRVPPLVPAYREVQVYRIPHAGYVPCGLMSKLEASLPARTVSQCPTDIPAHARYLRCSAPPPQAVGVSEVASELNPSAKRHKASLQDDPREVWTFEAAFGLPWDVDSFVQRACQAGHPLQANHRLSRDLEIALQRQLEMNEAQLSKHRHDWCKYWLKRAVELDPAEKETQAKLVEHVREAVAGKRLLVTREILESIGYEDCDALRFLSEGSPLAGPVPPCELFEEKFRPCLLTLKQLQSGAARRNEMIKAMTKPSGDAERDKWVYDETCAEVEKGWAIGPLEWDSLPQGSVISRRFGIQQGEKLRLIDDFSISGVNDSCTVQHKVDLHMVDTFAALLRSFFRGCQAKNMSSKLHAKTYDLKAAYRQVPVHPDHLKYAHFCVFNPKTQAPEVFRLKTLPFGAVHSVYTFLRLARMLHCIACRGVYLMNTNLYDDFTLAARPEGADSTASAMEMVFMLTGWAYAKDGKKATSFGDLCKSLGVLLDLSESHVGKCLIRNTEQRVRDLVSQIDKCLEAGRLGKQETLALRGRLGFANGSLHGRIGSLALKALSEHAYCTSPVISPEVALALELMKSRLQCGRPRTVDARPLDTIFVYTDASYCREDRTGGVGGVLVSSAGRSVAWFGFQLDPDTCKRFGAADKETIIYELEMCAAVLALVHWRAGLEDTLPVSLIDNDAVRYSFIRGSARGEIATKLMLFYLRSEAQCSSSTWFARVPSEGNISDYPSRSVAHPMLPNELDVTAEALTSFALLLEAL